MYFIPLSHEVQNIRQTHGFSISNSVDIVAEVWAWTKISYVKKQAPVKRQ